MSCFKKLSCLALCLVLTACGFQPLYVSAYDQWSLSYPLKIETIEDRHGQILRNYLLDRLVSRGTPCKPLYRLKITLTEQTIDIGVKKDETSSRKQVTVTAHMTLMDKDYKVVYTRKTATINSYDILTTNYYADDVATQYAVKESLRLLADKIRMLISAYLDSQGCPCYEEPPSSDPLN